MISRSDDSDRVLLSVSDSVSPPDYYVYVASGGQLVPIGNDYPGVKELMLGKTSTHTYRAEKGGSLIGLLTLPPEYEDGALPTVILPGGKTGFDRWNFDWLGHFLSLRGYAVFHAGARQVLSLGEVSGMDELGAWVSSAHSDLGSAVAYLVAAGITDPDRVCVLGMGYEGYLASMGAVLEPDRYACTLSVFGVVDLNAFVRLHFGRYWATSVFYNDVMRHRSEYSSEELLRYSPLTYVDSIETPMFFADSIPDRRRYSGWQAYEGSGPMARALDRAGKEVTYLELDEPLQFFDSDTRVQILRGIEEFLDTHVGN